MKKHFDRMLTLEYPIVEPHKDEHKLTQTGAGDK